MGLMVEIVNVRAIPRFSMLRYLTGKVDGAMELTAGLLDWLCSSNAVYERRRK